MMTESKNDTDCQKYYDDFIGYQLERQLVVVS